MQEAGKLPNVKCLALRCLLVMGMENVATIVDSIKQLKYCVGLLLNTSLAAQGALAHRLQRRPRPNHNNAKSGARPCLPPLGFNMAGGVK